MRTSVRGRTTQLQPRSAHVITRGIRHQREVRKRVASTEVRRDRPHADGRWSARWHLSRTNGTITMQRCGTRCRYAGGVLLGCQVPFHDGRPRRRACWAERLSNPTRSEKHIRVNSPSAKNHCMAPGTSKRTNREKPTVGWFTLAPRNILVALHLASHQRAKGTSRCSLRPPSRIPMTAGTSKQVSIMLTTPRGITRPPRSI